MTSVFLDLHRAIPVRLFTITAHDWTKRVYRRVYTSNHDVYPLSGTKPMEDDAWSEQVIGRGQTFVANRAEEFERLFFDHATITGLGCRSAATLPIVSPDGIVVGTVNLFDEEGWFTPDRVSAYQSEVERRLEGLLDAISASLA